jgi:hypothetical protein
MPVVEQTPSWQEEVCIVGEEMVAAQEGQEHGLAQQTRGDTCCCLTLAHCYVMGLMLWPTRQSQLLHQLQQMDLEWYYLHNKKRITFEDNTGISTI